MLRRPRYLFRYGVVLPKLEEPYARQWSFGLCLSLDDVLTAASGDPGALGHVEDTLSCFLNRPTPLVVYARVALGDAGVVNARTMISILYAIGWSCLTCR